MPNPRDVFVIHGRDEAARKALWSFLRALDLRPLDWVTIVAKTGEPMPFMAEVLRNAFADIQAAIILATPDDGAYLHERLREPRDRDYEREPTGQARPNVIFEAGMAVALQPHRTLMIEIGHLRPFSDFGGKNVVRFDGTPGSLQNIAARLRTAGCALNTHGTDWLDPDRFAGLDAYTRRF